MNVSTGSSFDISLGWGDSGDLVGFVLLNFECQFCWYCYSVMIVKVFASLKIFYL